MHTFKKFALSTALAAVMLPAVAFAEPVMQDVVNDKNNQRVMDARGNCVYTKWDAGSDQCGAEKATKQAALKREERTVYFDFNKSALKPSEKAKLDNVIQVIKNSREISSVNIVGHADRIGTSTYNQKLSMKRAESVKSYLATKGKVPTRNVELRALGESQPVTQCSDKEKRTQLISCLAEDRRVEIEFNYVK